MSERSERMARAAESGEELNDDERAIIDLTIAYTWALDDRRFEDLREVFAADATGDLAGVHCEGIDAILERIERGLSKLDATQHVISNQQVPRRRGHRDVPLLPRRPAHQARHAGRRPLHHERHLFRPSGAAARGLAHRAPDPGDPLDRGQPGRRRPLSSGGDARLVPGAWRRRTAPAQVRPTARNVPVTAFSLAMRWPRSSSTAAMRAASPLANAASVAQERTSLISS